MLMYEGGLWDRRTSIPQYEISTWDDPIMRPRDHNENGAYIKLKKERTIDE